MQPGDLDQKILIQRAARTSDGGGGFVVTWSSLALAWAKAEPLSGTERDGGEQTEAQERWRFTVRRSEAIAGVTAADRILWRGRVFNIRRLAEAGDRPLHQAIEAEEGVAT